MAERIARGAGCAKAGPLANPPALYDLRPVKVTARRLATAIAALCLLTGSGYWGFHKFRFHSSLDSSAHRTRFLRLYCLDLAQDSPGGRFPPAAALSAKIRESAHPPEVVGQFQDPVTLGWKPWHYFPNQKESDPPNRLLFASPPFDGQVLIARLDGSHEILSEGEFQALARTMPVASEPLIIDKDRSRKISHWSQ